jgi:transcriptional regulator with XRE-family HTH domain
MRTASDQELYNREATAARLREIRLQQGKTQADVAWLSGITQAALSNYENGKRDIPLRSLLALSGVLDVAPAALVPALDGAARPGQPEQIAS